MEKITIKEIKENGDWINITDSTGRKIGVCIRTKEGTEKNPKLKAMLAGKKEGDVVELSITKKGDNSFAWDVEEKKGGGKTFAAKDKSFEAAQTAVNAAAQAFALDKEKSDEKILALAEKLHGFIMSKVTKTAAASE